MRNAPLTAVLTTLIAALVACENEDGNAQADAGKAAGPGEQNAETKEPVQRGGIHELLRGAPNPRNAQKNVPKNALPDKMRDVLALGHDYANQLIRSVHQSRTALITGIYGASKLAAGGMRIVNTGTLSLAMGGRWVYQATPGDRLVIKAGPLVQEFVVLGAQGNMAAADPETWLGSPHVLKYRHRMKDVLDVEVTDTTANGQFRFTLKGKAYYNKKPLEADLAAAGTYFYQRDLAGYDMKSEYKVRGKLGGKDLDIDVDEDHEFRLIVAQSPTRRTGATRPRTGEVSVSRSSSGTRTVTYSNDKVRNRLRYGENTYQWKAQFTKDFVDGRPSIKLPTAWRCGGTVTRNGKPWGKYRAHSMARKIWGKWTGNIRVFVLETPEGKTVIQHFQ